MSDRYENPLSTRYASREMQAIFADDTKFSTWRRLWLALAESERELGLPISEAQIEEMSAHLTDIDYQAAAAYEAETRHDVVAHIRAYGDACPTAKPIIHLGATSCYVGDNTDIILQRRALLRIRQLLLAALAKLSLFAAAHKSLPCLAYTHFQPAQPTTVGKRAALWMQDLLSDLAQLDFVLGRLKFPGCKGTTGTGASFLALFDGDGQKVRELEQKIAARMDFAEVYPISGQTYSRKVDYEIMSLLSGIAQSAAKFAGDIRLLSHLGEVEEPFGAAQVGSSAMAYKKNPMRSERICSLARLVMVATLNPALTAGAQWLERTLDDSANRRITIPETFLATDGILALLINIADGMVVYPQMIAKHLNHELPFMASENILMYCVKKGGDRQLLHERIRVHASAATKKIKQEGGENDLLARILADGAFALTQVELDKILQAEHFIGLAREQTEAFLNEVQKVLDENAAYLDISIEITV